MSDNLEKILIAEVSDNTVHYDYFPFYQNVWLVRTNNIYSDLADSQFELENIGLDKDLIVISFLVQKNNYTKVDTIPEVIANDSSFYYNNIDRTLLVHFKDHKPFYFYRSIDIEIGFSLGFYSSPSNTIGEWNSVQYDPRLLNSPILTSELDDIFNAKQVFPSASISIDNNDLKYKNFNIGAGVKKKNGNFVRTLVWTGENANTALYEDFVVTYQGIIEKITEGTTIKIDMRDIRSSLKVKSPNRYLDTTPYPDIKDPDKEYLLPELWGKASRVPILALNEDVNDGGGTTDYQFMICDTTNHTIATDSVKAVYVNNKLVSGLTPTVQFNTTQNFAYIEIGRLNFAVNDGSGNRYENMDKVSIDVYGYLKGTDFKESDGTTTSNPTGLIENGLAVLREIIKNNTGKDYSSTYYNISEWKTFEDAAYDVGYFVSKQKTTQEQINELAASQLGEFIWNEDLKFTFDNNDFVSYAGEIQKHLFFPLDYFPVFAQDSTNVIAISRIGYERKWNTNDDELSYNWLIDETNEDDALIDYNSTITRNFPTLINNSTDAQNYATRSIVFTGISNDTFTITTSWDAFNLKAGQWLRVQADHTTEDLIGWTKCQIQKVAPKIDTWQVELKLRIFGYFKSLVINDVGITKDQKQILIEA
jgi:hypothetical protein